MVSSTSLIATLHTMFNRQFYHSSLTSPAYTLFFLMVAFPMVLKLLYVKLLLFIFVFFIVTIKVLKSGHFLLHRSIVLWTLFMVALSLFFSLIGLMNGAPGALKQAQIYAFWPMIYVIMISGITTLLYSGLHRVLIVSTILIGVYGCFFILTELHVMPQFIDLNFFDEEKFAFGLYEGYVEINFMGLNSLPFLIPYVMTALAISVPQEKSTAFSHIWLWLALIFGLATVIGSGRRAILLVTMLTPVFMFIFSFFLPIKLKQHSMKNMFALLMVTVAVASILFSYLSMKYDINLSSLYNMFMEGFDFGSTASESASIRRDQFSALINGWADSPLLGAGHGASAPGYIRDHEMPWAYELFYVALLYQVGLVGFLVYTAGIVWIYHMAIKIIKQGGYHGQMMIPLLVGMSCFLVTTATNPYLVRFDGIWVIFLPIAVINSWLLQTRGIKTTPLFRG